MWAVYEDKVSCVWRQVCGWYNLYNLCITYIIGARWAWLVLLWLSPARRGDRMQWVLEGVPPHVYRGALDRRHICLHCLRCKCVYISGVATTSRVWGCGCESWLHPSSDVMHWWLLILMLIGLFGWWFVVANRLKFAFYFFIMLEI